MNKSRVSGWRMKYACQLFKFKETNSGRSKVDIQKYDVIASFAENYIRNLRSQIDSRDWDSDVLLKGMWKPVKLKIDFNKKCQTTNELYMKIVSEVFAKWRQ